jgi:hypothetical protein
MDEAEIAAMEDREESLTDMAREQADWDSDD